MLILRKLLPDKVGITTMLKSSLNVYLFNYHWNQVWKILQCVLMDILTINEWLKVKWNLLNSSVCNLNMLLL